jgi:hypothetical protein
MAITVYWACLETEWMRAKTPELVLPKYIKDFNKSDNWVKYCPAIRDELKNTFALRSIYDYEFTLLKDSVSSTFYDQDFFDRHVVVRSMEDRSFSFTTNIVFFTEEPSLKMTGNIVPFLENNVISDRCMLVPGTFDIGKLFRNIEFGFHLKPQYDNFVINFDDVYQYVKFHTEEKVNLVQFKWSDTLVSYVRESVQTREYKKGFFNLDYYYKSSKTKKFILEEIKRNIL